MRGRHVATRRVPSWVRRLFERGPVTAVVPSLRGYPVSPVERR